MRQKLNLTLPEGMIEEMKIQAVREKRAVSEIVEELCRQYLGRQKKAKRRAKQAFQVRGSLRPAFQR